MRLLLLKQEAGEFASLSCREHRFANCGRNDTLSTARRRHRSKYCDDVLQWDFDCVPDVFFSQQVANRYFGIDDTGLTITKKPKSIFIRLATEQLFPLRGGYFWRMLEHRCIKRALDRHVSRADTYSVHVLCEPATWMRGSIST